MSVIIRLQNLPWSANAIDIRRFFQGLSIPDGGVHIVGGEHGDAFMAFSTDEDARKAMQQEGRCLGDAAVKLLLSSKNEMQNVIAAARKPAAGPPMMAPQDTPEFAPDVPMHAPDAPLFGGQQRFAPGPHPHRMPLGQPRPPNQWQERGPGFGRGAGAPPFANSPAQRPMIRGPSNPGGQPEGGPTFGMPNAYEMGGNEGDMPPGNQRDMPRHDGPQRPGFGRGAPNEQGFFDGNKGPMVGNQFGRDNNRNDGRGDGMPPRGRDNGPPHGRDGVPPRGRDDMPNRRDDMPNRRDDMPNLRDDMPDRRDDMSRRGREGMTPGARDGMPPGGRDGMPPSGRDGMAQRGRDGMTPRGRDGMAPGGRDGVTPGGRDGMAPRGRDGMTPGGRDGMTPGGRDGMAPRGRDGMTPGGRDGMTPGGRDGMAPRGRDDMTPGGRDGMTPGGRDGMAARGRDGMTPGGREGMTPGGRDGMAPRGRDGMTPGGRDSMMLGGRDGMAPRGRDGMTPGPGGRDGMMLRGRDGMVPRGRDGMAPRGRDGMTPGGRDGMTPGGRGGMPMMGQMGRSGMTPVGRGGMLTDETSPFGPGKVINDPQMAHAGPGRVDGDVWRSPDSEDPARCPPLMQREQPGFGRPTQMKDEGFGHGGPMPDRPGFGRGVRDSDGPRFEDPERRDQREFTGGPQQGRDQMRPSFGRGGPHGDGGFGRGDINRPGFGRGTPVNKGEQGFGRGRPQGNDGRPPRMSGDGSTVDAIPMDIDEPAFSNTGLPRDGMMGNFGGPVDGREFGHVREEPGMGRGDNREFRERREPGFDRNIPMRDGDGPRFGRGGPDLRGGPGFDGRNVNDNDQRFNREGFGHGGQFREQGPGFGRDGPAEANRPGLRPHPSERDGFHEEKSFGRGGQRGIGDNERNFPSAGAGAFGSAKPGEPPFGQNIGSLLGAGPGNTIGAMMPGVGKDTPDGDRQFKPFNGARAPRDRRFDSPPRRSRSDGHPSRSHSRDTDRLDRKRGRDSSQCVYITNLSRTVSFREVRKFFSGYEIPSNGLKLINDKNGSRIGDAYVKFAYAQIAAEAVKRNGAFLGDRRAKVQACSDSEFDRAMDSYQPGDSGPLDSSKRARSRSPRRPSDHDQCEAYIAIRELPLNVEKQDVKKFFSALRLVSGSLYIDFNEDMKKATAYLEVANKRDHKEALTYDKRTLRGQPVAISPISKREYEERISKIKKIAQAKSQSGGQNATTPIVIDDTTKESTAVVDKKPEAKSEAKSEARSEAKSDAKSTPSKTVVGKSEQVSDKAQPAAAGERYCVMLEGLPDTAKGATVQTFFDGLQVAKRGMHVIYKSDGKAAGNAYVEFTAEEFHKMALSRNMTHMGANRVKISSVSAEQMTKRIKADMDKATASQQSNDAASKSAATRGSFTVTIRNCNYRVTEREIEQFFAHCRPTRGSVRIQRDANKRPLGDATIAFPNQHDARRAVNDLNNKLMAGRAVKLSMG